MAKPTDNQPLIDRVPIVGADGLPTPYFIRLLKQRGLAVDDKITAEQAEELIDLWSANRDIIAGVGLDGGGTLASDVTIDLADTAVTPGVYGDATHSAQITVDQQGRITTATEVPISGGGGGGGYPYEVAPTLPVSTDFTLQNGGSATVTDSSYGMLLDSPAGSSQIRFLNYTGGGALPSTWIMTMRSEGINPFNNNSYNSCFIMRNSGTGQIIITGEYQYHQFLIQRWNGYGSYKANLFGPTGKNPSGHWQQVEKTATHLIFRVSPNGQDWFQYGTEALASFITTVDEAGIGVMTNGDITGTTFQSFTLV